MPAVQYRVAGNFPRCKILQIFATNACDLHAREWQCYARKKTNHVSLIGASTYGENGKLSIRESVDSLCRDGADAQ